MLIVVTILILLFAGCSDKATTPDGTPVELGQQFTLASGQRASIQSEELQVTFTRVLFDSRCPPDSNVDCIWPGVARIELRLVRQGTCTTWVFAAIRGYVGIADTSRHLHVDVAGYRLTLLELNPQPDIDHTPVDCYYSTLVIHRMNGGGDFTEDVLITDSAPGMIHLAPFGLDSCSINGDILNMRICHSGGCADHDYFLFMSPAAFLESYPAQANLYLQHMDNNDPCDGMLYPQLSFNLVPIARLYEEMYGTFDPIVLNVHEYLADGSGKTISVIYYPVSFW